MSASAILKLQGAGFSAEQVTAIAELIDTQSASRADVEALEHRVTLQIAEFRAASELRISEFRTEIAEFRAASDLRATRAEAKITLLQWMMGFILAFQVAIFIKMFMR